MADENAYRAVLGDLQTEIVSLEERISDLQAERKRIEAIVNGLKQRLESQVQRGPFANMTVVTAATLYLAQTNQAVPTRKLADDLKAGGFRTDSKDFSNTVYAILSREVATNPHGPIRKVGSHWAHTAPEDDIPF